MGYVHLIFQKVWSFSIEYFFRFESIFKSLCLLGILFERLKISWWQNIKYENILNHFFPLENYCTLKKKPSHLLSIISKRLYPIIRFRGKSLDSAPSRPFYQTAPTSSIGLKGIRLMHDAYLKRNAELDEIYLAPLAQTIWTTSYIAPSSYWRGLFNEYVYNYLVC